MPTDKEPSLEPNTSQILVAVLTPLQSVSLLLPSFKKGVFQVYLQRNLNS